VDEEEDELESADEDEDELLFLRESGTANQGAA